MSKYYGISVFAILLLFISIGCSLETIELPLFDYYVLPEKTFSGDSARILLFGDSGSGTEIQSDVSRGMALRHSINPFDFAIMLGDNFYEMGVRSVSDPQFDTKFRYMYPVSDFSFPFYVVLGNHDYYGNALAQYNYKDPDGRWIAPSPAYLQPLSFSDNRSVDIYFLDSKYISESSYSKIIFEWVSENITSRHADLNILATHYPFYSSGEHGDDEDMLRLFTPLFSAGLIDITVSGHDHDLELQGRDRNGDGITELFIVSGSASKSRNITPGPYSEYASSEYGFCELTLSPSETVAAFYDKFGDILFTKGIIQ